ncbi:MAG: metallophosphoesterase [Planctomycetaceae bacterium]|jgi:predicted MPP superfamily phosphohydrolase|nr:metallophosphoesterase [Planctomycetaceae bacterium]
MFWIIIYNILMCVVDILLLCVVWFRPLLSFFWLVCLCVVGCVAAVLLGIGNLNLSAHGLAWHGSAFLVCTGTILFFRNKKYNRRISLPILCFVIAFFVFCFSFWALCVEPTWIEIVRYKYKTNLVIQPIRVAFLADFQTDNIGNYERRTLNLLREQNADLIILGGDYIQANNKEKELQLIKEFNLLLKEIKLSAKFGVYALKGNQELVRWYDWKRSFIGTEIKTIEQTRRINVGELRVVLLSMWDSFSQRKISSTKYALNKNNNQIPKHCILMAGHSPRYALAEQYAHIVLAGHTHGGQVAIPFFGALINMTTGLPKHWSSGDHKLPNGSILIVSKGVGMERGHAPRIRFNCKPDFVIIDVVPEK